MAGGKPRKPTNVLKLTGAFKKNPNRSRPDEPEPSGSFPDSPPAHLTRGEKSAWADIVAKALPGVLGNSDVFIVEALAVLLARFRNEKSEMPPPLISRMTIILGQLGMSPSDRAKLKVTKPRENKFAE